MTLTLTDPPHGDDTRASMWTPCRNCGRLTWDRVICHLCESEHNEAWSLVRVLFLGGILGIALGFSAWRWWVG